MRSPTAKATVLPFPRVTPREKAQYDRGWAMREIAERIDQAPRGAGLALSGREARILRDFLEDVFERRVFS